MPTKTNIDKLRDDAKPDDTGAVRQELDGIKAKLDELGAAQKGTPAAAEIEQIKASVDAVVATVADIPGTYETLIKALEKRIDKMQTGAALNVGSDTPEGIKAITKEIAETDDTYKALFDDNGRRAGMIAAPGQFSHAKAIESFAAARFKAAAPVVISDMAGGNLTAYRPGILEAREFAMGLADRIPSVIVKNATTYAVPRETAESRHAAWISTLSAQLDGDPTPKSTATFTDVVGLMVGSVVRFFNASHVLLGSSTVVSIDAGTKVVTFATNSLAWDAESGDRVTSENYTVIAELGQKPSGYVGTENVEFTLKSLPVIVPTTVNAINTIMGLAAMIERKLPYREQRNMSRHLLYGDDGAAQLQGLRTYTGAQSYLWSSGVGGDNQVDAIMRAANQIAWGVPLACIMNQVDQPALYLLKGGDGHYLRTGNFGMVPLTQVGMRWFLGPIELVFDFANASGDFTIINFAGASEIADQDTASLAWGYINDDFEKNIVRARYEATKAHAIIDVNEYVVGEWDGTP
jgi:hypothetical protein